MLWWAGGGRRSPPAAAGPPLSLPPPVAAVPVNTPPTFDAAKFKLVEVTAALPALLRATAPVRLLVCVDRSIVVADAKVLMLASVSTPLSVIAPIVDVAVSGPPTVDVPRFSAAASMIAAPVPVFNETGQLKIFPALARVIVCVPEVVKLPPAAVSAPL